MNAPLDPLTLLAQRSAELSPKLANAAHYVLSHPEDAALLTLRELADKAGVHASTMNRLGVELGFGGFGGMKQMFQEWLRANRAGFTDKARSLQAVEEVDDDHATLVSRMYDDQKANLEICRGANSPAVMTAAAQLIAQSTNVYVLGLRSGHPVAWSFYYAYKMFHDNARLLTGHAGAISDELRRFGKNDLLLVNSVAPYSRETVAATEFARLQQGRIIALTDSDDSPLAGLADIHLRIGAVGPSLFPSIAAGVAVAEALVAILIAEGGAPVVEAVADSEAKFSRINAYWWPEDLPHGPESKR